MGRVAAPYAVRGWIKIHTYTEYLDSLLDYPVWWLGKPGNWQPYTVLEGKPHSQFLVAQLEGVDDRNKSEAMVGMEIAVPRDEMPEADEGEYYWDDLIGLTVVNLLGETLGKVKGLIETGAHDVLKVEGDRERLIPFTDPILQEVDLDSGRILVDWGLDY